MMNDLVIRRSDLRASKVETLDLPCGAAGNEFSRKTRFWAMNTARMVESPAKLVR